MMASVVPGSPTLADACDPTASPPPVLVFADDSPAQRAMVSSVLADAYRVVAVADGAAVLRVVQEERPDAILSDLHMPGLGGVDLLRLVKADPRLRHIPFILITGEERAGLRTLESGADDFLRKPYGPEELRARVAAAVRSHRMFRELQVQHAELVRIHSESKRLMLELQQAQKLEAIGRLAAGIAHEINTPIQFIGDNTSFLKSAFAHIVSLLRTYQEAVSRGRLESATAEALASVAEEEDISYFIEQVPGTIASTLEGVERVARIVRAMKEFAHPDQKEMTSTDLNRALEATVQVTRSEYKYVADVNVAFRPISSVLCHAGEINQVFLNIIVNAAHAIEDVVRASGVRGEIGVATRQDGDQVVVSISDTGGGIPEEIRHKVFDPFFTTKDVGRGTGQGLAIARSVVQRHQGRISFESTMGTGTTFEIRLPVEPSASAASAQEVIG